MNQDLLKRLLHAMTGRKISHFLSEERRGRLLELTLTLQITMPPGQARTNLIRETYTFADNEPFDKDVVYGKMLEHVFAQGCINTLASDIVATMEETV